MKIFTFGGTGESFLGNVLGFWHAAAQVVIFWNILGKFKQLQARQGHFLRMYCKIWHLSYTFVRVDAKIGTSLTLLAVWMQNLEPLSHSWPFGCKIWHLSHTLGRWDAKFELDLGVLATQLLRDVAYTHLISVAWLGLTPTWGGNSMQSFQSSSWR